jgi:hypothetical protein
MAVQLSQDGTTLGYFPVTHQSGQDTGTLSFKFGYCLLLLFKFRYLCNRLVDNSVIKSVFFSHSQNISFSICCIVNMIIYQATYLYDF